MPYTITTNSPAATQAPAQQPRAGQARYDDVAYIAGYESGVREPEAWKHIGAEMRKGAPPICYRHHARHAQLPRRSIVTMIVDAIKGWLS